MSAGDMNSSNCSDQQRDTTNDFNLNSELSIDESTGQENAQYSDKKVFDRELNADIISDKSEDNHKQKNDYETNIQVSQNSEQNIDDTKHISSTTDDALIQENSKELDKNENIEGDESSNNKEQNSQENVTKDINEVTDTESTKEESGTKSEHDLVLGDSETSISDNKTNEKDVKLEPKLATEDTKILNTDKSNDKTEAGLESEADNSENKSNESDPKKELDGVNDQGEHESIENDQQVENVPDDQKDAKEDDAYNDDFEEDTENQTIEDQNTNLDQQAHTDEKVTTEKDIERQAIQDSEQSVCDNQHIPSESGDTQTQENNTTDDKDDKDDSHLNTESFENNIDSGKIDIDPNSSEIKIDEQKDENDKNEKDDNDAKKIDDSESLGKQDDNKQDDTSQVKEPSDNQTSNNQSDTNKDTINASINDASKNLEQDKEPYKADEDNDDFWDIDEPDNKKEKEQSTIKQSDIKGETSEVTEGHSTSISLTESDTKDNNKMETPRSETNQNNEKLPADQGEVLTGKDNNDIMENNKNSKDVDKQVSRTDENEVKNDELKEPPPPPPQPVPEPEPEPEKRESLLDQLLKRNVEIDGSVQAISELENNVTTLLQSMKTVVKHYGEILGQQSLREFSQDMGKFRGDFQSINDAYMRCCQLATTMNSHLKEMRHATEDVKTMIYRKFQNEDLATWIDVEPEKETEKQKLQEEAIAAEKAAMAKASEARSAMATATVGVAEANQFVAEMEVQSAEAEAIAKKASTHAQQALVAAEEARLAAIEKRKAEELAKQRAEERARKKEEEERKKAAEEEMKIYQEAARKGTSADDERKLFQQEKERREAERRDPKNWPRYTYAVESGDFDPRVGCIIRAIDGTLRKDELGCRRVGQETGILQLTNNEELISNIIEVTPTDPERKFHFEEPMSVALPVCIKRTPFAREAVIKILQSSDRWSELQTADVVFDDHRELRFVETRIKKFGTFVVVLRYKKDSLMLLKRGCKVTSGIDSRVSFTSRPGTFKVDSNFSLEVHPVDQNNVSDLRVRAPQECEDLYTCSPFIRLTLPTRKTLTKPLTITLPLPPYNNRLKRPQTAVARDTTRDVEARPSTARPQSTQERKEESTEEIHFVYLDERTGWTKSTKIILTQITNKDMVAFDITEPHQRFIVLRTKTGLKNFMVEKMASLLDRTLTQRNVRTFLRQRNEDLYDVAIACETSDKTERALQRLTEEGFAEGGPPSKDLILTEGQPLYLRFRGNVKCVNDKPRLDLIFNTHIKSRTDLKVMELDTFAQKGLPCYRGFAQVFTRALVPKPLQEGTTRKPNEPPEMVEAEILLAELLIEIPKPEVEPPKPLTVVPVKLVDGPLNDSVFHHLANELGKEWKDLATYLNLKPTRIQAILRQNVNKDTPKTRYDMLVSWAKRIPKSVDKIQILVQALQAAGRPDLAEEMRYRGDEFRQQRFMSARVSHLRQAFVKVAKVNAVFKHWKEFAKGLGVPDTEINKIDEKGGSGQEKVYSSLETWKELSGEKATVQDLATHLKDVRQERLSRDVEALVAS